MVTSDRYCLFLSPPLFLRQEEVDVPILEYNCLSKYQSCKHKIDAEDICTVISP